MTYDPARERVVLFGGRGSSGNLGDTWEYDGTTWTKLEVTGPSPRNGHAMVYDARSKVVMLFGGRDEPAYFNDLWVFDGAWRKIPPR
jgi:N-acetylneuraminic acid mutarotase